MFLRLLLFSLQCPLVCIQQRCVNALYFLECDFNNFRRDVKRYLNFLKMNSETIKDKNAFIVCCYTAAGMAVLSQIYLNSIEFKEQGT